MVFIYEIYLTFTYIDDFLDYVEKIKRFSKKHVDLEDQPQDSKE